MSIRCRCTVGGCLNCKCSKNNVPCSPDCNCGDICVNRANDAIPTRMDNDALNAALMAIAARFDAQEVNQQNLGNALQALANSFTARCKSTRRSCTTGSSRWGPGNTRARSNVFWLPLRIDCRLASTGQ